MIYIIPNWGDVNIEDSSMDNTFEPAELFLNTLLLYLVFIITLTWEPIFDIAVFINWLISMGWLLINMLDKLYYSPMC